MMAWICYLSLVCARRCGSAVCPPQMPSLDYKARLAMQHSTRKGLAFEKFDESRAVGRLHDPVGLGTGFGVSDRVTGPGAGAPRTRGLPP